MTLGANFSIASGKLLLILETTKVDSENVGVILDLKPFSAFLTLKLRSETPLSLLDLCSIEKARLFFITEIKVTIQVV